MENNKYDVSIWMIMWSFFGNKKAILIDLLEMYNAMLLFTSE